jgi:hypothetical protein
VLGRFGAGSFTGEVGTLAGRAAAATRRAVSDCEVIVIDEESLRALVIAEAELSETIMRAYILRRVAFIPLPLRRVLLQVTVPRESEDKSRAQLGALFNSPVGAYLTGTKAIRDMDNVHFDIGPEDLDSAMYTLIVTLPKR